MTKPAAICWSFFDWCGQWYIYQSSFNLALKHIQI